MEDEKRQVNPLVDEELTEVNAGMTKYRDHDTGRYYRWAETDCNKKYLCPKCRRPLKSRWGFRYDCDPCDSWWVIEGNLIPDPQYWVEISSEDYHNPGLNT